jgi:hypothetical protein
MDLFSPRGKSYEAGGYTKRSIEVKNSFLNLNKKIGHYPNGKAIESFFPNITKNEALRKEAAKFIE